MKLHILAIALAATAFGSVANAQTTVIEERRAPGAVVIERDRPETSVTTTKERSGFLGTDSKTTTTTTGTGPTGDCSTRTVQKEDLAGSRSVSSTNCN